MLSIFSEPTSIQVFLDGLLPVPLCVSVTQLCPILCDPMDHNPSSPSVHGILQARILEWIAIPFSRGSPHPGIVPRSPELQAFFITRVTKKYSSSALQICMTNCLRDIAIWMSQIQSFLFPEYTVPSEFLILVMTQPSKPNTGRRPGLLHSLTHQIVLILSP